MIVITADRFRFRSLNRDDAIARLVALLDEAAVPAKPRRKTRQALASKERRIAGKKERSGLKRLRRDKPGME